MTGNTAGAGGGGIYVDVSADQAQRFDQAVVSGNTPPPQCVGNCIGF